MAEYSQKGKACCATGAFAISAARNGGVSQKHRHRVSQAARISPPFAGRLASPGGPCLLFCKQFCRDFSVRVTTLHEKGARMVGMPNRPRRAFAEISFEGAHFYAAAYGSLAQRQMGEEDTVSHLAEWGRSAGGRGITVPILMSGAIPRGSALQQKRYGVGRVGAEGCCWSG